MSVPILLIFIIQGYVHTGFLLAVCKPRKPLLLQNQQDHCLASPDASLGSAMLSRAQAHPDPCSWQHGGVTGNANPISFPQQGPRGLLGPKGPPGPPGPPVSSRGCRPPQAVS